MQDAIIVLGGGIDAQGELPPIPKYRLEKGIGLFKQRVAPTLIFSGKWGFLADFTPPRPEAEAAAEYAESLGVPATAILQETASMDTIGNAYFTKKQILEPHNWTTVTVVTSEYHADRTQYIFDKVLGPDYTCDVVGADSHLSAEELQAKVVVERRILTFTREHLDSIANGDDKAIFTLLQKFPGYSATPEYTINELRDLIAGIKNT